MVRRLLLAPLLPMAAACGPNMPGEGAREAAPPPPAPAASSMRAEAVALALLPPNRAGATAAASGMLAVRGPCLVLEAAGERLDLAFATPATEWDEAGGLLRVGARRFRPGTRVTVGGALFTGDFQRLSWVRAPAAPCAGRLWIVGSIDAA